MSINSQQLPDYELPDAVELTTPAQLRAIADPLRSSILDLVLERAATVAELAAAAHASSATTGSGSPPSRSSAGRPASARAARRSGAPPS